MSKMGLELFDQAIKKLAIAQTLEEINEWKKISERARTLLEIGKKLRV